MISSTGTGRIASVSREDLALAAATVLSTSGHDGAVYELIRGPGPSTSSRSSPSHTPADR